MKFTRFLYLITVILMIAIGLVWEGVGAQQQSQGSRGSQQKVRTPELIVQTGHTGMIRDIAFSPDGKYLVSCGEDSSIRLWETRSGRLIRVFTGHNGEVHAIAFSRDGKTIVSGGEDHQIRIWDVSTGEILQVLSGHSEAVFEITFSPAGDLLASSGFDGKVILWNTSTWQQANTLVIPPSVRFGKAEKDKTLSAMSELGISAPQITCAESLLFDPQGKMIAAFTNSEVLLLWDVKTGKLSRTFGKAKDASIWTGSIPPAHETSLAFSSDGMSLGVDQGNSFSYWNVKSGSLIRKISQEKYGLLTVVTLSPNGTLIAAEDLTENNNYVLVIEASSGNIIRRIPYHQVIGDAVFSPDGKILAASDIQEVITLYNIESGEIVTAMQGSSGISSAGFSRDSRKLITADADGVVALWDMLEGKVLDQFSIDNSGLIRAAISPDNKLIVAAAERQGVILYDSEKKSVIHHFDKKGTVSALSKDGKSIFIGAEGTIEEYDVSSHRLIRSFEKHYSKDKDTSQRTLDPVVAIALTKDGKKIAASIRDGREVVRLKPQSRRGLDASDGLGAIAIWDVGTGRKIQALPTGEDLVLSLAFDPDGELLASAHRRPAASSVDKRYKDNGTVVVWNLKDRTYSELPEEDLPNFAISIDPQGSFMAWGGGSNLVRVFGEDKIRNFEGHSSSVTSIEFTSDGQVIASSGFDGTTRLWKTKTGEQLAKLVSFRNGDWAVLGTDGRFDTNNLEEIKSLHWVAPDDPLKPLPLEIFMRQYYEPRLLPRILAGEKFKPIPKISELNRVQPSVKISKIAAQSNTSDEVTVAIEVASAKGEFLSGGGKITKESGAKDLRLFRDGQLVGYRDGDLKVDPQTGQATLTFTNIKLPRKPDTKQVEFSAYAFNVDNVKSATDRRTYELPTTLAPVKGRAYVITVGVNAYENPEYDLNFAASDAQLMQQSLTAELAKRGEYTEIVSVPLLSDYEIRSGGKVVSSRELKQEAMENGQRVVTERLATKANVKTVLDLLAGRQVAPADVARIPNAEKLQRARPEDLVVITFASHGYADRKGEGKFYFVTYDIGASSDFDEMLRRSISSDELSLWLRDVDAGEMAMIVDACQSSAAITGEGFKPGPMGSRGLGQLSYEKGMRILAATQEDNYAWESDKVKHGWLTYTLVHEGLELGRADFKPEDKTITLTEWLAYAVDRVPKLQECLRSNRTDCLPDGSVRLLVSNKPAAKIQQPSLFDFSRKRRDVVLIKK